jgi:F-type H+-transporting ATPase subunit b
MELLKLLSTNEIVAQIIGFLLLLTLLRAFVWKRILKVLDERKERIASEFKEVEEARAGAAKLKSDYEKQIAAIEEVGKTKIHEAIIEGKRIVEEIRKGAERDSQRLLDNTRETIKAEISKAREEVRDDIIDLAISAAEKVFEERLAPEDDKKLVEFFLNRVIKKGEKPQQ